MEKAQQQRNYEYDLAFRIGSERRDDVKTLAMQQSPEPLDRLPSDVVRVVRGEEGLDNDAKGLNVKLSPEVELSVISAQTTPVSSLEWQNQKEQEPEAAPSKAEYVDW